MPPTGKIQLFYKQAGGSAQTASGLHVEREISPWGDESDVGGGKPVVPSGLVQVSSAVSGLNYLMGANSLGAVGWGSRIGHGDVYDEVPPRTKVGASTPSGPPVAAPVLLGAFE